MARAASISRSTRSRRVGARLTTWAGALALVATTGLVAAPGAAQAAGTQTGFEFLNFTGTRDLVLNGNAKTVGSALRLTDRQYDQNSSVWYDSPIEPTASFESRFTVSLHDGTDDGLPADGVAFVIQASGAGTAAVGTGGLGIGYGDISPSIAVEFDDWLNDYDPNANHVAINKNGDFRTPLATADPDFALYGNPFTAWVDYDADTHGLSVYASQEPTKPAKPLVATTVDLSSVLGKSSRAYAGFTSATGNHFEQADLTSWSFGKARAEVPAPGYTYVAMGDSFSSGEGAKNSDFYPDSTTHYDVTDGEIGCHRAKHAYSTAIKKDLKVRDADFKFVACSGAVVANMRTSNDTYVKNGLAVERPQTSFVTRATKVVTLTAGGNDANFVPILKDCAFDPIGKSDGMPDCRKPGRIANTKAAEGLENLRDGRLSALYEQIARQMAPGGTVVVVGYPRLFGTTKFARKPLSYKDKAFVGCRVGTARALANVGITDLDTKWINTQVDEAGDIIAAEVAKANRVAQADNGVQIVYAIADPSFSKHRICDSKSNWINGAKFNGLNANADQRSFHPNRKGHAAYAKAIRKQRKTYA